MSNNRVIVIGGGPAGLMAAGQAAQQGANTMLLEKMDRPGRKLRITGKGRCNLTNVAPVSDFISHFGTNGRFLHQTFSQFFYPDLISFFDNLGLPTIKERGGRVFPAEGNAPGLVDTLIKWVLGKGVKIKNHTKVVGLLSSGQNRISGVEVIIDPGKSTAPSVKESIQAERVIIATGGASYPDTGSTGDGYALAESVGHTITPTRPALVPLEISVDIVPRLENFKLRNVNVRLLVDGKKHAELFGELFFRHSSVSGPVILTLSRKAVDAILMGKSVILSIDLKPALDEAKFDRRLLRDLDIQGKRQFQSILKGLLPKRLIPLCIESTGISREKICHQITAEERKRVLKWLKDFRLEVKGYRPFSEAIITAGGVVLKEIDPRTMASRITEGLYFAGEVMDLDGDTGGFNLQTAFSTGWVAGRSAASKRKAESNNRPCLSVKS
ncbi:NAD(P)/FAD-dependent oxidoreductase [Thermodesulfobacteriota bacterium]